MNPRIIPIIGVCVLIVLILGGVFLWQPEYDKFKKLSLDLAVKTKELEQKQAYFANLTGISKKLEGYKEELTKLDNALPSGLSFPDLFNYIQKTASENGIVLEAISSGGEPGVVPNQDAQEVLFPVSLSGPYSSFKNFLSAIYQNSRLIEVRSISFVPPEKGKTDFKWSLNLSASYLSQ